MILVIGRQGQVASDLREAATASGTALVAKGRPDCDLTDFDSIRRTFDAVQPSIVINAAAYTAVDRAESEPDLAFALNRDGPGFLARLCARSRIPLIHLSTDQVFDGSKREAYTENDAANPLCLYGRSKLQGEEAVREADGTSLILRISWVFGPSGDNFVKKLLGWAATRESLRIVSDQHGKPTCSPHLADILLKLASAGKDFPEILHVAGQTSLSRYQQALQVMEASAARGGPHAEIEPVLTKDFITPAKRPLNAELDTSLAARYGITMNPFSADLERTLDRSIGKRKAVS